MNPNLKTGIVFRTEYSTIIKSLSPEDARRLIDAFFEYSRTEQLPEFDGALRAIFDYIIANQDEDWKEWEEVLGGDGVE